MNIFFKFREKTVAHLSLSSARQRNTMSFNTSDYFTSVYNLYRLEKKFIDATIILDDSTTHMVHKPLLAIHSPFFGALFAHENKSTYSLKNVPTGEFVSILDWIYQHKMTLSLEKSIDLAIVADYLDCPEVVDVACQNIKSYITVNNVCEILDTCNFHNLDDLANACRKFIRCHFEEVSKEEGFLKLDHQSLKVILSSETVNASDLNIWEALAKWIEWDKESRVDFLPQLLPCINEAKIPQFESKLGKLLESVSSRYQAIDLVKSLLEASPKKFRHTLIAGGGAPRDMLTFDMTTNEWSYLALPDCPDHFYLMEAIGHIIYLVGSKFEDRSYYSMCHTLDIKTGRLTKVSPTEKIRDSFSLATHNGSLYCFGGHSEFSDSHQFKSSEKYNPEQNQWVPIPKMMEPHTYGACAVVGERIYVAGGMYSKQVEYFDTKYNTWNIAPTMKSRRESLSLLVVNDELYAIGGIEVFEGQEGSTLNTCEKLKTSGWFSSWKAISPMISPRSHFGSAVVDGKIIVAGGWENPDTVLTSAEIYDPKTDVWTSIAPLPDPKFNFSLVFIPDFDIVWSDLAKDDDEPI